MSRQRVILLETGLVEDEPVLTPSDFNGPVPFLVPIDLTKGTKSSHPDFRADQLYLYKVGGLWCCGRPHRQWFGWPFSGWIGGTIQWDAPGSNSSSWEYIFELHYEKLEQPMAALAPNTRYRKVLCNDGSGCPRGYNLVANSAITDDWLIHIDTNNEKLVDAMLNAVNQVSERQSNG